MTLVSRRAAFQSLLAAGCCGLHGSRAAAKAPGDLLCAFGSASAATDSLRDADGEALQVMQLITAGVGLQPNFQVKASDSPLPGLAYATIRDGRRRIVYDATVFFFGEGRTDWLALGVLAHEIGHHLANHIYLDEISRHGQELEADHFAGAAVARLGGTLDQALAWTPIVSERGSDTHPPRSQRREAVIKGWNSIKMPGSQGSASCRSHWVGDEREIAGRLCRRAQVCKAGQPQLRKACRDPAGNWIWED